jgi:hypothetical protein
MRLFEIGKNLTNYSNPLPSTEFVKDRTYHTDIDFRGAYMLGLAFGGRDAPATKRLAINAEDCREIFEQQSLPLISQWAILVNMPEIKTQDYSIDSRSLGSVGTEAALNTREAMEIARERVISGYGRNSLKEAIYIAHPAHMQRVIWIGEKLDFKGIPFLDTEQIWNSNVVDGTSSPSRWRRQEFAKRLHHLWNRWI